MKTSILLSMLSISLMSLLFNPTGDAHDYEKAWKEVAQDLEKGLPKSALEKVQKIYAIAQQEENMQQVVKATLYRTRLVLDTEELGLEQVIADLDQAIGESSSPTQQILQSYAAEIVQGYYSSQYWRISERTDLGEALPLDMRTWAPRNYRDYISTMYLSSLQGDKIRELDSKEVLQLLQRSEQDVDLSLRPTLYDLLADRALQYFSQTRLQGLQPSFRFSMDDAAYLGTADEFVDYTIKSADSTSLVYRAALLYQVALQRNSRNEAAHTDYNLQRLRFVQQYGKVPSAKELYLGTLLNEIENTAGSPSEISYRLAKMAELQSQGYLAEALKEARLILRKDATPSQKAQAENAIKSILQPTLSIQTEQVYTDKEALLYRVDYKNLAKVHLRLLKLSARDLERIKARKWNDTSDPLRGAERVREWSVATSLDTSYQHQSMELVTEELPLGTYALVASNDERFRTETDAYYYSLFHVSNIGYTSQTRAQGELLNVVDRTTGKPLPNVEVKVYELVYDRGQRKQIRKLQQTLTTDLYGQVAIQNRSDRNNNLALVFRQGKDELDLDENIYTYRSNSQRTSSRITEIFTDRAIYRPAQSVHWKILAMTKDKYGKPSIVPNEVYVVILRDANRQEVSKVSVSTNEYGSASGTFELPTGLLTGNWSIETSHGQKSIRVEEYKRPKFEVIIDKSEDKVALGEQVTVTGKATALSGSPVTDGKLTYTVTRHTYYGWWSWYRRSASASVQVTTGELQTAADGSFTFDFTALAEANMDIKTNPTYTYEVEVNVTDVAGETRSATERISVTALPYSYDIGLSQTIIEKSALESVMLSAKNTSGSKVDSKAILTITELKQPTEWQKPRYWQAGKYQQIDNGLWDRLDRIGTQGQIGIQTYELGKEVHRATVSINGEGLAYAVSKHVDAGKCYEIKLVSEESFAQDTQIEQKTRVAVHQITKSKLTPLSLLYVAGDDGQWEAGKEVTLTLATPDKELEVYYTIKRDWEVLKSGLMTVEGKATLKYTPVPEDQGGISVHLSYTKHNRSYSSNHNIQLPWSDKMLDVELVTKRDKVLPGSKESWTIKIKGPLKDKIAAEMLATMYDASLDEFASHSYAFSPYPSHYGYVRGRAHGFGTGTNSLLNNSWNRIEYEHWSPRYTPVLQGVNYYTARMSPFRSKDEVVITAYRAPLIEMDDTTSGSTVTGEMRRSRPMKSVDAIAATTAGVSNESEGDLSMRGGRSEDAEYFVDGVRIGDLVGPPPPPSFQARTNLEETVFFYPHLRTDADGNILLDFTMNEALTKWKLLTFAHTKDLKYGMTSHEVKTQKDLMIVPNAPRFMREGDRLVFPATVTNLTEEPLTANVLLELENPISSSDVADVFQLAQMQKSVDVPAGESARVEWELQVPKDYKQLVKYTVKAWSGTHTDGEENMVPVLTNQMMVTETEVLSVRKFETKTFAVKALEKDSKTMVPHALTLEYTSNPVWYAVQALPYIMEYPYECTEQIFNRYYANTLASHIATANPRISEIFKVWKAADSDALLSNLEKNEELKYAILEESPWVRQAQSDSEQKKRIALLFDMNKMANETTATLQILKTLQLPDGSFPWFSGGRGDEYITQVVVMGIAHLERLGVLMQDRDDYADMLSNALTYLDERSKKRYDLLRTRSADHLDYRSIQYLYIRSFYADRPFTKGSKEAYDYYFGQAKKHWLGKGLYSEALIGIVMLRAGEQTASDIKASLTQRSFYSEELGRYWNLGSSYMWYQLPIETHAKMIEFFTETNADGDFVENTKIWLLKNKQTNHWATTKATADAIYALLLQGENGQMISWIEETNAPEISFGNQTIEIAANDLEAGTGYIKKRYDAASITEEMAKVTVKNNSETIGWGAVYYQYFEDLDKIESFADNPLTLNKALYKEEATDYGPKLVDLNSGDALAVGDRVICRVELKVDRDMSYVHLKDMRPSGFEPENALSQYKWQDGMGYYESTRDLATNFFISHLNKGTYVFEYPMRVVHRGEFSTGIASLQCMYAPEYTSHSAGIRVVVE